MVLWQLVCGPVLLNMSMFAAPCNIGRPHQCNFTWNSCFVLIDYGEGKCNAQMCLLQDSWESPLVDSCSSFYGSLWHHVLVPCTCTSVLLLFCHCAHWMPCLVVYPHYHNFKTSLLKPGISHNRCVLNIIVILNYQTHYWCKSIIILIINLFQSTPKQECNLDK